MPIARRAVLAGGMHLAAAGAVSALTGRVAVAARPAAATDRLSMPDSPLWREFVAAPYRHPQIPNVSFAGYRTGAALPRPPQRVNAVDHGADPGGVTDSAAAINRAIAAAGAAGGGAVLLPAGNYRIDDVVNVGYNGVVLRGDGSGRTVLRPTRSLTEVIGVHRVRAGDANSAWSWTGGLVWVSHRDRFRQLVRSIKATTMAPETWTGTQVLATATATANRGSFVLTVGDTSRLRVGQRVLLRLDDDAGHGLLRHMAGDIAGAASYNWADKTKLLAFRPFVWPVMIAAINGPRVTLAQPLPLDVRPAWNARLTSVGPVVTDAGVEGLTIALPRLPQPRHLQDKGFNGLVFQCAWDCWADDVRVVDADNGILLTCAKGITLSRTRVGGRMRHHSYTCRLWSHDNLFTDFAIEAATTPLPSGSGHHGINVEGLACGNVWSNGRMDNGTFDTHRLLPFGCVRTQIVINNDGAHGGSADAGPLYGARFTHWNVTVTNGRAGCVKIDQMAPHSATVGISAVREFGQIDRPDFTGPLETRLDSYATTAVTPANLYAAQLQLRRSAAPTTVPAGGALSG